VTPPPIAHSGHVLVDLGIFLGPMALLAGWLKLSDRRQAKRERDEPPER
jgi:hypothetical protein